MLYRTDVTAADESQVTPFEPEMERLAGRLTLVLWQLAVLIAGVAALVIKAFA